MKVSGVLKIGHNKMISGGTKRSVIISNTAPTTLHIQHVKGNESQSTRDCKAAAVF